MPRNDCSTLESIKFRRINDRLGNKSTRCFEPRPRGRLTVRKKPLPRQTSRTSQRTFSVRPKNACIGCRTQASPRTFRDHSVSARATYRPCPPRASSCFSSRLALCASIRIFPRKWDTLFLREHLRWGHCGTPMRLCSWLLQPTPGPTSSFAWASGSLTLENRT